MEEKSIAVLSSTRKPIRRETKIDTPTRTSNAQVVCSNANSISKLCEPMREHKYFEVMNTTETQISQNS
jgi:hypothetical protein